VARPEGTIDVPRRHRDVLSQLVLALLLWLVMWCHSIIFVAAGVVGVCNGGWGWSNDGSGRRWSLVAVVTQQMWVVAEDGGSVDAHLIFRQTPLTWLNIKTGGCELLSNIKAEFVSHQSNCVFMYRLDRISVAAATTLVF
jgi:hypothetical protein